MRVLVDIPDSDLKLVDKVSKRRDISRAQFIREAVASSLTPYRHKMDHAAFGLLSDLGEDGLAFQERMRAEW